MKKTMVIILVFLCIFVLLAVFLNPNRGLMLNEFTSIFKPTVFFNYQFNIDNIKEAEIMGAITLKNADKRNHVYADKHKIQKIINYLNGILLVEASRDKLPNMSPDVTIQFSDSSEKITGSIWIYGQMFIEDKQSGKLYKSKSAGIIEGIEKIDF